MKSIKPLALLFLVTAAFPLASYEAKTCPIERAHYRYTNGVGAADFIVMRGMHGLSDLALHITVKDQDANPQINQGSKPFWFLFNHGSARFTSLISTTNVLSPNWTNPESKSGGMSPLSDTPNFYAWGSDMKVLGDAPREGDAAPEVIFLPELANILYYAIPSNGRLMINTGMFKFDHCAAKAVVRLVPPDLRSGP